MKFDAVSKLGDTIAPTAVSTIQIRLLCPSLEIWSLMEKIEREVFVPILTKPLFFCVLKDGIMGYLAYKIRSHDVYEKVHDLFEKILSPISVSFSNKWSYILTSKLFDYYQRSAANDFVTKMCDTIKSLRNCSERLQFRTQVMTDSVMNITSDNFTS